VCQVSGGRGGGGGAGAGEAAGGGADAFPDDGMVGDEMSTRKP
jgi:hypothetical protein